MASIDKNNTLFNFNTGTYIKTEDNAGDGKYSVGYSTYPADLLASGGAKYGNAWVMFNINVQGQTEYGKGGGYSGYEYVELSDVEKRRNSEFDARDQTTGQATAAAATSGAVVGALGSLGGSALRGFLGSSGGGNAGAAAIRGAGAGLLFAAPAMLSSGTAKRETKRIKHAIQLPMPNSLMTGYSIDWGEDPTALFDMMMRAPGLGARAVGSVFTGDMKTASSLGSQAGDAATSLSLSMNKTGNNGGISAMTGLAANPKKEMIFNGVGFRSFTLEYKLSPKNYSEQMSIDTIIRLFKFHMHPEYKSEGRYTFIYPSEFDITFYTKDGSENKWVTKIATCVLTDMRVNYTPDGQWVSNEGNPGNGAGAAPNSYQISMTFKELSILTKDTVAAGF
jgi:hypothetical protein